MRSIIMSMTCSGDQAPGGFGPSGQAARNHRFQATKACDREVKPVRDDAVANVDQRQRSADQAKRDKKNEK